MSLSIEKFRLVPAADLVRYRVGGATRCVVAECMAMRVQSGFMVAGLLIVAGLVIVNKNGG